MKIQDELTHGFDLGDSVNTDIQARVRKDCPSIETKSGEKSKVANFSRQRLRAISAR